MKSQSKLLVLCANLARRKDRRFVMEQTLPEVCGQAVRFFEAVDGEVIPSRKLQGKPEHASPSSYAVRLTKRLALRTFLQSDKDHLLFLEDDLVVTNGFDTAVQEASKRNHEVTFLGGGHALPPIGEGRWRQCVQPYNNHALLFSREGARKALAIWRQWQRGTSDVELQYAIKDGLIEAWSIHPWVAYQRETRSDNWGNTDQVSLTEFSDTFMQPDDLAVLDAAAKPGSTVLEYGCGHSTLHLASKLQDHGHLVSVEHNSHWFLKTQLKLRSHGLHAECLIEPPRPFHAEDGPWRFLPGQLKRYVNAPLTFLGPESVDLLFIDGRERIQCALTCASLLKPGAFMMIHDFWSRMRYRARLPDLLQEYDYLFESPGRDGEDPQGMAVFQKK